MKVWWSDDRSVVVEMSTDQLLLLAGSVREAVSEVSEVDFHSRVGVSVAEARWVLTELNRIWASIPRDQA